MPRSFVLAAVALHVVVTAGSARADDVVPVRVTLAAPAIDVDLGRVITEAPAVTEGSSLRLDGALFAGLASAGFVVAEAPGAELPPTRPVAGLSPRLLRGGGVVCDVHVSF